jgi:acyl carrier protein
MKLKFLSRIKSVLEIENRELSFDDKFREYPEWDSLAYLSLIVLLDEEYNTQIEETAFKQLQTLGDIYSATEQK